MACNLQICSLFLRTACTKIVLLEMLVDLKPQRCTVRILFLPLPLNSLVRESLHVPLCPLHLTASALVSRL
jgi:hypothetical protein